MERVELTVQVHNLSKKITEADLTIFFSYCGTIENIKLHRDGDESQTAFVTFRQPYAQKTALLLDDAIILDRRVRVSSLGDSVSIPIITGPRESMADKSQKENEKKQSPATRAQSVLQAITYEALNRAREIDAIVGISDRGRLLAQQATSAIIAAQKSMGSVGSAIVNNSYRSAAAATLWLSGVLDKTAKCSVELGHSSKVRETNSRKKK